MEQANGGRPGRRDVVAAVIWVLAILAAGALAGCGSAQGPAPAHHGAPPGQDGPDAVAPPIVPGLWLRAAAHASPRAARAKRPKPRVSWLINPDKPLPRDSPWRPVLAVARRFAVADMSYEVDEVGPAVRSTITRTCTHSFAAALLSHRATLPPGLTADQVRQRLVALLPLQRLSGAAVVLTSVRSRGRGGAPGAFELRLVRRSGGWRVAGLSVV